jgi:ectoine hydroxylase-related dioxygenase (phytanoyl-CoA dioxygenase family)
MELRPGQVSFHHCKLIHGSLPNTGTTPRIALAVHFQDASNRYTPAVDDGGNPVVHVNDVLCRPDPTGSPDYSELTSGRAKYGPKFWPVVAPGPDQQMQNSLRSGSRMTAK